MIGENDMVVEPPSGPLENRSVSPISTIPDFVSPGPSDHRQSVFDSSSSQMQLDFGDPPLCATVEPLRPHFREGSFSKQMAELRLKKDLCELKRNRVTCDFAKTKVIFPRDHNVLDLRLIVSPVRGPYTGGKFEFNVSIPPMYPFYAPKVICLTKVYHPNICMNTGRVYIAILGKDWRPVLTVNAVLLGLQLIFLEPNPNFPVNPECCEVYKHDPVLFGKLVRQSVKFSDGEQIRSCRAPSPSSMMMVNDDNGPFASASVPWRKPLSNDTRTVVQKSKRRGNPDETNELEKMSLQTTDMPVKKRMRKSVSLQQRQIVTRSAGVPRYRQQDMGRSLNGFSRSPPRRAPSPRAMHSFFYSIGSS